MDKKNLSAEAPQPAPSIDETIVSREVASSEKLDALMNTENPYKQEVQQDDSDEEQDNSEPVAFEVAPDDKAFLDWGDLPAQQQEEEPDEEVDSNEKPAEETTQQDAENTTETKENNDKGDIPNWITETLKEFMEEGEEPQQAISRVTTRIKELEQELQEESDTIDRLANVFEKNPDIHEMVKMLDKGYTAEEAIVSSLDLDTLIDMKKDPNLREKLIEQKVRRELEQKTAKERIQTNYQVSTSNLQQFYEETQMDDTGKADFSKKVDALIQPITEGLLTKELLTVIQKGLMYDNDVRKATDSGKTAGLNTNVKKEIQRKRGDGLPNAGSKVIDSSSKGGNGFISKSLITNGTWG